MSEKEIIDKLNLMIDDFLYEHDRLKIINPEIYYEIMSLQIQLVEDIKENKDIRENKLNILRYLFLAASAQCVFYLRLIYKEIKSIEKWMFEFTQDYDKFIKEQKRENTRYINLGEI